MGAGTDPPQRTNSSISGISTNALMCWEPAFCLPMSVEPRPIRLLTRLELPGPAAARSRGLALPLAVGVRMAAGFPSAGRTGTMWRWAFDLKTSS